MQNSVPGFKTFLIGPTGSGKTHSIRTLLDCGLKVRVLFLEPGMEGLSDLPTGDLAWHYVRPSNPDWSDMIDSAKKINSMNIESLSKLTDINKRKYDEFIRILQALSDFPDDRTGQSLGAVDDWGTDTALVIDGLSGLNIAAMNLVVGSKPMKNMADWGIAMDNEERLVQKLCFGPLCHFVLIGHTEREVDEVTGGTRVMASALGRKMAPKLPRFFSDVVLTRREGTKFTWSTADTQTDLKARNLAIQDGLPPTFKVIHDAWKARQK